MGIEDPGWPGDEGAVPLSGLPAKASSIPRKGWTLQEGPNGVHHYAPPAQAGPSDRVQDLLTRMIAKWRRACELTREELKTIRKDHPEGPRYGIAAVAWCDVEDAFATIERESRSYAPFADLPESPKRDAALARWRKA